MIVHICSRATLESARVTGELRADSLAEVGFVHCSDPGTVHLPATTVYAGRTDLVLAVVDPARVEVPVRWEPGVRAGQAQDAAGPWFPHVYGPIPWDAVAAVHEFPPEPDGTFHPPASLTGRG